MNVRPIFITCFVITLGLLLATNLSGCASKPKKLHDAIKEAIDCELYYRCHGVPV